MGNYTGGSTTICPYYIKEADKSITCESLIEGVGSMMRFTDTEKKRRHQVEYCESVDYSLCPHAASIRQRYDTGSRIDANSVQNDANSERVQARLTMGEMIAHIRKKRTMPQAELAKRANISRSYLNDLENDRRNPSIQTLGLVAKALGVSSKVFMR